MISSRPLIGPPPPLNWHNRVFFITGVTISKRQSGKSRRILVMCSSPFVMLNKKKIFQKYMYTFYWVNMVSLFSDVKVNKFGFT